MRFEILTVVNVYHLVTAMRCYDVTITSITSILSESYSISFDVT